MCVCVCVCVCVRSDVEDIPGFSEPACNLFTHDFGHFPHFIF